VSIQFKIYDSETNGNVLWSETQSVSVVDGLFSVLLGSVTPIQLSVFNGDDRYLALQVGNDSEMAPRNRLVSVGYSFRASDSDKLDGKDGSAFVQRVDGVTPDGSGNVDLVAGNNVTITPDDPNNHIVISASGGTGGDNDWTISGDNMFSAVSGNVGIGATYPIFGLHVKRLSEFPTRFGVEWQKPGIGAIRDWFYYAVGGEQLLQGGVNMVRETGSTLRFSTQDSIQSGQIVEQMRLHGNGNVGIGTSNPQAKLDVYTDQGYSVYGKHKDGIYGFLASEQFGAYGKHSNGNFGYLGGMYSAVFGEGGIGVMAIGNSVGPAFIATNTSTGDIMRGQNASDNIVFRVHNDGTTTTKVLEITGGSDLAEPFDIKGPGDIKPGMVVAIDPAHQGQLRIADKAYDRTVAGIVSGANGIDPGLTMRQEGTVTDESLPVALTGRVYAWADASTGSIEPGDLLTTSDTPGYAMKVTDYERAHGAVLGKAMSSLDKGKGLV
ncbi:MAG: hypothetical protein JSW07_10585, partial [bacterium]